MAFNPPHTPQGARPSRFIYPPEVLRSRERAQATLESIVTPFFNRLDAMYWGRPAYMGWDAIRQTLNRIQADYMRHLTRHFFISPIAEHPLALYILRHQMRWLENTFEGDLIDIEVDPFNRDIFPTEAIRANARAEKHESRWQQVIRTMVRDGSWRRDWGEMRLENFVRMMMNHMVLLVSLELEMVERARYMRKGGERRRRASF
ncbi:hypothetical protein NEUTE1DRAFT_41308 [Neurospora tetrasperma FGSC 2508]|uniref:Uncharacterized protein n=1 Tax=Neurospora tetrasperma (strain FGSC 2508 / ATCC MYA-4615 / P0657) TaxID=510951 RepID=F8MLP6_NEUT8|nr:uncharacterized protein NEUTE1DRAFT_41308 [Neurospora tetrasperma FGSC 2508]EGO58465.1 hypothetical protein NEUTE1DRAFT_41308 [Neurospora tetrasperma FGSC 2508]EGZ71201.1 hypothetical protein NEUTE2DRAFT_66492 [Neurospora tetrasperma FGSC 2509]